MGTSEHHLGKTIAVQSQTKVLSEAWLCAGATSLQVRSEAVLWRHGLLTMPPTVGLCLGGVEVRAFLYGPCLQASRYVNEVICGAMACSPCRPLWAFVWEVSR